MSWGDFPLGQTLNHFFTTRAFATGIPTVLAGVPVLSVYEDANLVEITAGVTVTVDSDAKVGLNRANIVATGANGYETGKSYTVVITTGTVGGVSVVGEVVGTFTIERSAVFARVGAPAGASVSADNAAIKSETALIVADTNELQTDDIPTLVADVPTVAEFNARTLVAASYFDPAADAVATVTAVTNAVGITAAAVDSILDEDMTGHQTLGTLGQAIGDPVANTKSLYAAAITDAAGVSVSADVIAVKADTAATLVDTTGLNGDAMRGTDNAALASVATEGRLAELDAGNLPLTTDGIKTKTDSLTFTVAGDVDANLQSVDGAVGVVAAFRRSLLNIHEGTTTSAGTTTTAIDTSLTHTDIDQLKGRIVIFEGNVTGGLRDQATDITGFDPALDTITFTALTVATGSGDRYVII